MLERKLMKENTQENKENYRKIKNTYNWKLKDVRRSYFRRCLNENKEDPKSLNRIINKLTGKNVTPILPRHGSAIQASVFVCLREYFIIC